MEEALWRVLQQRRGSSGGIGYVEAEEEEGDFIEYHLYLDNVGASSDPGTSLAGRPVRWMDAPGPTAKILYLTRIMHPSILSIHSSQPRSSRPPPRSCWR